MATLHDFPENNNDKLKFSHKIDMKGKDRNKLCICGSGKKIKDCCGSHKNV